MGDGVARVIAPDTVPHFCAVGVTDRVVLTLVCQWSTLITAFSENLVRAPFKKKIGWPDRSSRGLSPVGSTTEMGVDIGHAHLCTLQ